MGTDGVAMARHGLGTDGVISVILGTDGVAMARHGPILREIEATPSGELLKDLPGPPGPVFGPKTTKTHKIRGNPEFPYFPVYFADVSDAGGPHRWPPQACWQDVSGL